MIFDKKSITNLRLSVKGRMSEGRYTHTLGVEELARHLGTILIPESVSELCVAALLHDIAKEIDFEEQIALLTSSKFEHTQEDIDTLPALHSISALPIIEKDFNEYATENVLSAVSNHTLGNSEMSIFDEIIFISDYAESGRTYSSCKEVREYLIQNVCLNNDYEDNVKALHTASLAAVNHTIDSLSKRGNKIHTKTFLTKKYLIDLISKYII